MAQEQSSVVTFLFTDIEASTQLLTRDPGAYPAIVAAQRTLIARAARERGGFVFGYEGDACFVVFADATAAIKAAGAAQRSLAGHSCPGGRSVRVRMGLPTGAAELNDDDYYGLAVHVVARVVDAAHGGQVLLADVTRRAGAPATGWTCVDLGAFRLRGIDDPVEVTQIAELRRQLFGSKAEKLSPDEQAQMDELARDLQQEAQKPPPLSQEVLEEERRDQRRRRAERRPPRHPVPPVLETETVTLEPAAEEKLCPHCGRPKQRIGEEVSEETDLVPAKLIGHDPKTDLALLKFNPGKPMPYVKWGNSDNAKVGDWVLAIGNPFGLGGSVTAGIVSARGRNIESGPYDNYIQIVARADSGIRTIADLKGKRVSVGPARSPIEVNARALLRAAMDADVGDPTGRPDETRAELEGLGHADCLDGDIGARAVLVFQSGLCRRHGDGGGEGRVTHSWNSPVGMRGSVAEKAKRGRSPLPAPISNRICGRR